MATPPIGRSLKHWRSVRGLSQLELALRAGISARHLSFVETGRSRPGERVVLDLAEALDLPLRERNALLAAAGLTPAYRETPLDAEVLAPFRRTMELILRGHEPFPAFALDRWWNVVDANDTARRLFPNLAQADSADMLEILYGPGPLRDSIVNWAELAWGGLEAVRRDARATGFPDRLMALIERMETWLEGVPRPEPRAEEAGIVACPVFRFGDQTVSTVVTTTTFGGARDVTLEELRIEQIFPADAEAEAFFSGPDRA